MAVPIDLHGRNASQQPCALLTRRQPWPAPGSAAPATSQQGLDPVAIMHFSVVTFHPRALAHMSILIRLIYASKVASHFGPMDMHDILAKSRRNNINVGVGGLLVMSDGHFFQALEGGRAAVHRTYGRILRDPRHADSVILSCQEIGKRSFTDWSMGYVLSNEKNRKLFLSYSAESRFLPFHFSAPMAEALLQEIGDHARQIGGAELAV